MSHTSRFLAMLVFCVGVLEHPRCVLALFLQNTGDTLGAVGKMRDSIAMPRRFSPLDPDKFGRRLAGSVSVGHIRIFGRNIEMHESGSTRAEAICSACAVGADRRSSLRGGYRAGRPRRTSWRLVWTEPAQRLLQRIPWQEAARVDAAVALRLNTSGGPLTATVFTSDRRRREETSCPHGIESSRRRAPVEGDGESEIGAPRLFRVVVRGSSW